MQKIRMHEHEHDYIPKFDKFYCPIDLKRYCDTGDLQEDKYHCRYRYIKSKHLQ